MIYYIRNAIYNKDVFSLFCTEHIIWSYLSMLLILVSLSWYKNIIEPPKWNYQVSKSMFKKESFTSSYEVHLEEHNKEPKASQYLEMGFWGQESPVL